MSIASLLSRRGAIARSGVGGGGGTPGVTTLSYPSFPSIPVGSLDVAMTVGAGATGVSGTTLLEGNSITTSAGYDSALVLPDVMAVTTTISVTVTIGALGVASNVRGNGGGVFAADGTKGVYVFIPSASGNCRVHSFASGTVSNRTLSTQVGVPGDTVTLTGTLAAGVWTWTVKKNGGADISALTWADSGHLIDLPGPRVAPIFRHQYSGSQLTSRGVAALSATAA